MKRVLVTGASGFIGRHTLPLLHEHGFEVHAIAMHPQDNAEGIHWHQADLLNAAERKALIEKVRPTHVLHCAWIATPGVYWTSPLNEDWKTATLDLLALCQEAGVTRFVGSGSCAEYDWNGDGDRDEQTTPLRPDTPYGRAKATCGQAVIGASSHEFHTAWGRIFFLYGPFERPERLVPSVILSLLKGGTAQCTHGRQIRDFLHVRDVASAFVALLESAVTGPVNIASGNAVTIREVVETVGRHLNALDRIRFDVIPAPAKEPPRLTASVDRLRKEVGWQPQYSLEEGIADTIAWWKKMQQDRVSP